MSIHFLSRKWSALCYITTVEIREEINIQVELKAFIRVRFMKNSKNHFQAKRLQFVVFGSFSNNSLCECIFATMLLKINGHEYVKCIDGIVEFVASFRRDWPVTGWFPSYQNLMRCSTSRWLFTSLWWGLSTFPLTKCYDFFTKKRSLYLNRKLFPTSNHQNALSYTLSSVLWCVVCYIWPASSCL